MIAPKFSPWCLCALELRVFSWFFRKSPRKSKRLAPGIPSVNTGNGGLPWRCKQSFSNGARQQLGFRPARGRNRMNARIDNWNFWKKPSFSQCHQCLKKCWPFPSNRWKKNSAVPSILCSQNLSIQYVPARDVKTICSPSWWLPLLSQPFIRGSSEDA